MAALKKTIVCTVINDLTYDRRMIRICTTLQDAGFDVLLIGRKLSKSLPLVAQPFRQYRMRCFINKGKLFYLEYNLRLFFRLLFTRMNILNTIDLDTMPAGFMVAKLRGKPQVYDAHEYFTEVPEVIHRPLVRKIWKWVERVTVPRIRWAYTVSPAISRLFTEKYGTDFKTVMNAPVLVQQDITPVSTTEKFILYQGALNKGRGLEHMIMAMHDISGCSLWIIGEGDLSHSLREMVKREHLVDRVKFLGFVAPENLAPYTAAAFAGLNVSENLGLSYYYSLNNKFFDYIHAALPAVTNKFPEYMELNSRYDVCLLSDGNIESLAASFNKLLDDAELYNRLKHNCIHARQELNWQKEAQKLLSLYLAIPS